MSLLLNLLQLTGPPPSLFAVIKCRQDEVDAELLFQVIINTESSDCLRFALKYLLANHALNQRNHHLALISALGNPCILSDDILSILERLITLEADVSDLADVVSTVLVSYSSNKLILGTTLKIYKKYFSSETFCNKINPFDLLNAGSKNMDDDDIFGQLVSILANSSFQPYAWRHTECKILISTIRGRAITGRKLIGQVCGYILKMLQGKSREKCCKNFLEAGAIRVIIPLLVPSEIIDIVLDVLNELLLLRPEGYFDAKTEDKICIYLERIQQSQPKEIIFKILRLLILPKEKIIPVPLTAKKELKLKAVEEAINPAPLIVPAPSSVFSNLHSIIEQQIDGDSFIRLEVAGTIKDMIIGSDIENIDMETTSTIIKYLLQTFTDLDYIICISASALALLAQSMRNREIIHSFGGLEAILKLIDSSFNLEVIEQALKCLYYFSAQKEYAAPIARNGGIGLLLGFNHSCHFNVREIALACLEHLLFYGDMKSEKELIVSNSIWEKVIKQWGEDLSWDDDGCMFKTFAEGPKKKTATTKRKKPRKK